MDICMKFLFTLLNLCLPFYLLANTTDDPYKAIRFFTLDNGMKAYVLSNDNAVNTQIEISVKVGRSVETDDHAGLSHLVEHLIFRDQRIPHKDYLDYITDEGATDVNGYTEDYETRYVATINSDKSYWLVETFATMLFDKSVTSEDLEIEKKALQTEIGEAQWHEPVINVYAKLMDLFPERADIFRDDFLLSPSYERPSNYRYKTNNGRFTFDDVMQHYSDYYYPANMTLKVVGRFDADAMESLIKDVYGNIYKEGNKAATEPPYDAQLSHLPYKLYYTGQGNRNYAYIGAKYLLDDYRKYLVLQTYVQYLSRNMQQMLRNKLGQTYSVNPFDNVNRNAGIIGISFSSLHEDFQPNIALIRQQIQNDSTGMNTADIQEALAQSALYYSTVENDSDSLMSLIHAQAYLHEYHDNYTQTPYDVFTSITPEIFQQEIQRTFSPENSAFYQNLAYGFFPYDVLVMSISMFVIVLIFFKQAYKLHLMRKNLSYTSREILFSRRLTNRFYATLYFIFIFIFATLISQWSEHFFFKWVFGNPYYAYTIATPYDYLYHWISFAWFMLLFYILATNTVSRLFTRIEVIENRINIIGSSLCTVSKQEIAEIKRVRWSIEKSFKTFGASLLFYRPLVMIALADGRTFYMRTSNADELTADLTEWLNPAR